MVRPHSSSAAATAEGAACCSSAVADSTGVFVTVWNRGHIPVEALRVCTRLPASAIATNAVAETDFARFACLRVRTRHRAGSQHEEDNDGGNPPAFGVL